MSLYHSAWNLNGFENRNHYICYEFVILHYIEFILKCSFSSPMIDFKFFLCNHYFCKYKGKEMINLSNLRWLMIMQNINFWTKKSLRFINESHMLFDRLFSFKYKFWIYSDLLLLQQNQTDIIMSSWRRNGIFWRLEIKHIQYISYCRFTTV